MEVKRGGGLFLLVILLVICVWDAMAITRRIRIKMTSGPLDGRHFSFGLKARQMTAQGNALGKAIQFKFCPERAIQKRNPPVVLPFQGVFAFGCSSQGVALGCHVLALSAR